MPKLEDINKIIEAQGALSRQIGESHELNEISTQLTHLHTLLQSGSNASATDIEEQSIQLESFCRALVQQLKDDSLDPEAEVSAEKIKKLSTHFRRSCRFK